jgi:hypothetical protein
MTTETNTTLNARDTFWDIVAVKDSIDSISWKLVDDRNLPHESMAKVDLHNAKVELNKALEKLYILIQEEER